MYKIIFYSLSLILLLSTLSCKSNKTKGMDNKNSISTLDKEHNAFVIYLKRGACFGQCPQDEIAFYTNGTVIYKGERNVENIGWFKANVDTKIIEEIQSKINTIDFEKMPNEFGLDISDLPEKNITVKLTASNKDIKYIRTDNKDLNELVIFLSKFVGSLKWTEIKE